jgi:hypothetical protein
VAARHGQRRVMMRETDQGLGLDHDASASFGQKYQIHPDPVVLAERRRICVISARDLRVPSTDFLSGDGGDRVVTR